MADATSTSSPAGAGEPAEERELSVVEVVRLANQLQQQEQWDEAERVYRMVLGAVPDHPEAAHFLGVLLHRRGRSDEGIEWIRKAIAAAPDYADAHYNLGNVFRALDREDDALAAYQLAIRANPEFANAYLQAANVLYSLKRPEEGLAVLEAALAARPDLPRVYERYGHGLRISGAVAEAAAVFRRWLEREPDNPKARHLLLACTGEAAPPRAPDDYIRQEFDGFSASFDTKLQKLQYRAPELVISAVEQECGPPEPRWDVLDAGCGTGLCGPQIRPWAASLTGIDLSEGMLEKARGRGVYDELIAGELTEHLRARRNTYDLTIAADVLVYFGDLQEVLSAAAGALKAGGRFIFTVEEAAEPGYLLTSSGRYSHSQRYVREALATAGLECRALVQVHLRLELGKPVNGLLVTAGRGEDAG